ncbi:hypothetical protein [Brevibacillus centrosporus]|uniref:Uncharacterized protein n=1 Tax=Brevibacillus centrosporus TaxID=54910 RepID=A0A1I3SKD8_9BACL|nr:hypothetical protein [Brevibacillus centrosporus]MEC2132304.1 hypothetical protein [Brevibacillus centrosporus]MED4909454.1 hypothetical protein [Brevibacillus centrosporus]GED33166.1 hypothetical protein BCE02nite_43070 [Brevibacillus centrosporus]SFJ58111.1 hypothetical protein SAMN05518846_104175 [Brevibacillus centrosporus]
MKLTNIPFTVTDWSAIEPTEQEPPIGERSIFMTCGFDLSNTDDTSPHRSATKFGAKLFIVD